MARNALNLAQSYMGKYVRNITGKQYSISYSREELTALEGVGIFLIRNGSLKL